MLMSFKIYRILFPVITFITNFYISFNSVSYTFSASHFPLAEDHFNNNFPTLKNKLLLDLKYKLKKQIKLTKEISSVTFDCEGKIFGYKDVTLGQNKIYLTNLTRGQRLKQSTIWGTMKLTKM